MLSAGTGSVGLWAAVVGLGIYHGLNPSMGWPLAVANGLAARRDRAVFATLVPLGAGHFGAMAALLLPFAVLGELLPWSQAIRVGAGVLLLAFGLWKLVDRRHPRALARVPPTRLAWWSFLMATAHGAGLMLLPFALGLCLPSRALVPPGAGVGVALLVALVHTLAMIGSGLVVAWLVYRWLGLKALARGWLNLDTVWALSLLVAGGASIALARSAY
jgi:hypothetical protein